MNHRVMALLLITSATIATPVLAKEAGRAPVAEAAAASARRPPIIPTADFAHRALIEHPTLSPDGSKLLAQVRIDGKPKLGLIAADTGRITSFALPPGHELVSYRWGGDAKVLISVGRTAPFMGSEIYVTRLIAYDVASGKSEFIGRKDEGPEGDDILHVDPDGKWLLLSIQRTVYDYPSVFRVDLETGAMTEIVRPRPEVWEWYADNDGVVRAGIGFDDSKWSMIYRASAEQGFRQVAGARHGNAAASLGLMRFAPGSDEGFILSSDQTGRDALYRFNFATLELGERVFEVAANDVSDVILSPDGRSVRAAFYTDDRDRVTWFDPRMKALQADLDRAVGDKEAWIVSRSRDDSRMLVLVTGANDPGAYYYFIPEAGVMRRIAYVNERMKGHRLASSRPVRYRARDGLDIPAYLTLPPGREAKGLPLIVMPHGGPFGVRDRGGYDPEVQMLANRGYAVLQPNFRGSESYGRDFEERGNGQWGRAMQDDLDDGMDWLTREGIADPQRVCLVGSSYGGYAAMWGATRNPERYRCAASFAGISDIGRQLRHSRDFFINPKSARRWKERVRGAEAFDVAQVSPINHVERLRVPLLIAHGAGDQRVPLKQSSLYAAALRRAGKPHEYHVYAGEGHGFSDPANLKTHLDRLEAFLRKHNPPD
jgi:dipeptidyl aminopeptidase/acylaminoacyl peptidase